jgi:hypothetical protein
LKPEIETTSKVIACRLNEAAIARLEELKLESGLGTRELFERVLLAGKTVVQQKSKSKPRKDYLALIGQINKAGNNINQIARHFNQLKGNIDNDDLKAAIALLVNIESTLYEFLQNAD